MNTSCCLQKEQTSSQTLLLKKQSQFLIATNSPYTGIHKEKNASKTICNPT